MFDHLPSIADKDKLIYSPENVLKDVSTIIYLVKRRSDEIIWEVFLKLVFWYFFILKKTAILTNPVHA